MRDPNWGAIVPAIGDDECAIASIPALGEVPAHSFDRVLHQNLAARGFLHSALAFIGAVHLSVAAALMLLRLGDPHFGGWPLV